ncbi:hypothetical protein [Paenibacillus sp. FSL R7-0272]|uniref:hypothetical protein n=1 Tax=Paenibacillus sp. FSL R7-0272 TaxID=2921679 RepID=UPI0029593D15|nr:hypothetical protein [Paenibacillus intestini]
MSTGTLSEITKRSELLILEYLKKYAKKAYGEVHSITTSPGFLFANDPKLREKELYHNYFYIHGFNRLIKHNRISSEKLIETFSYLEEEIEQYLKTYYKSKDFILYLKADSLVPAFTVTLLSYYEDEGLKESCSLPELIDWYKENACFDGLKIIENETSEDHLEVQSEDIFPVVAKTYIKIIRT